MDLGRLEGIMPLKEQIPTENQLSEQFNIGRLTVNKALIPPVKKVTKNKCVI